MPCFDILLTRVTARLGDRAAAHSVPREPGSDLIADHGRTGSIQHLPSVPTERCRAAEIEDLLHHAPELTVGHPECAVAFFIVAANLPVVCAAGNVSCFGRVYAGDRIPFAPVTGPTAHKETRFVERFVVIGTAAQPS